MQGPTFQTIAQSRASNKRQKTAHFMAVLDKPDTTVADEIRAAGMEDEIKAALAGSSDADVRAAAARRRKKAA